MKRLLFTGILFLQIIPIMGQVYQTADKKASITTIKLFNNLFKVLPEGILFGHQDDLAYGLGWEYIPGKSVIQDAVGEYPAVYGWELG
nr:hypothetical protein [Sediminibacterium sp.]